MTGVRRQGSARCVDCGARLPDIRRATRASRCPDCELVELRRRLVADPAPEARGLVRLGSGHWVPRELVGG